MEIKYLCKIIQIWLEPTTPVIQAYVCVHLTNVFIGNISGIIFTWSTYYRVIVLVFVCLRISHYRVSIYISKQRALSLEVTCNFRLHLKIGWTYVKPSWKHWIFKRNYHCLHTGIPYTTAYGWNRPMFNAQCSLFIYSYTFVKHNIY